MTQVFIFHIGLSLTVAMVAENGRENRPKWRKCHFGPKLVVLQTVFSKIRYQHSQIPKRCLDILCNLISFIIHLNIFLVFACALC